MGEPTMTELREQLARIESKLDMLIMALAEEDDEGNEIVELSLKRNRIGKYEVQIKIKKRNGDLEWLTASDREG